MGALLNPWALFGAAAAFIAALAGATATGYHYGKLEERNDWIEVQTQWEAEKDAAIKQVESERRTLQDYVSNTLAPAFEQLSAERNRFRTDLASRTAQHLEASPSARDPGCDVDERVLADINEAIRGATRGSLAVSPIDSSLSGAATPAGKGAGGPGAQAPGGGSAVLRLQRSP